MTTVNAMEEFDYVSLESMLGFFNNCVSENLKYYDILRYTMIYFILIDEWRIGFLTEAIKKYELFQCNLRIRYLLFISRMPLSVSIK